MSMHNPPHPGELIFDVYLKLLAARQKVGFLCKITMIFGKLNKV